MGSADDLVNFALGRSLRGKIAADRGDLEAAERLARDAVELASRSDFPHVHARAFEALAHVLRAAGGTDESRRLVEQAVAAHERHGDLVLAKRDRALLVEL